MSSGKGICDSDIKTSTSQLRGVAGEQFSVVEGYTALNCLSLLCCASQYHHNFGGI